MTDLSCGTTLFLDVETQRLAQDVGGWGHISKLGLAAAVTYNAADGLFRHYTEELVADLIQSLRSAGLVVGFNVLRFDYEVLRPYAQGELDTAPTLDILAIIYHRLGYRLSLDSLAAATLGRRKSGSGIEAVHWYREGRLDKVLAYCQEDVAITRDLYTYGKEHGRLKYHDRYRGLQSVPVDW